MSTKFSIRCKITGMRSTPQETLVKAIDVAKKEGFIELNNRWVHKGTQEARDHAAGIR